MILTGCIIDIFSFLFFIYDKWQVWTEKKNLSVQSLREVSHRSVFLLNQISRVVQLTETFYSKLL